MNFPRTYGVRHSLLYLICMLFTVVAATAAFANRAADETSGQVSANAPGRSNPVPFNAEAAADRGRGVDLAIIERFGQLAVARVDGGSFSESRLVDKPGVVASFGQSSKTGELLVGVMGPLGVDLYSMSLGTEPENLVEASILGAEWSHDGGRFLFFTQRGDLYLVDAGHRKRVATGVTGASFSRDGSMIAFVRPRSELEARLPGLERHSADDSRAHASERRERSLADSGLFVLSLRSNQLRRVSEQVADNWWYLGYAPAWSPDDRRIVFLGEDSSSDEASPLWIALMESQQAYPLGAAAELPAPTTPFYWSADGRHVFYGADRLDGDAETRGVVFDDDVHARGRLVTIGSPLYSRGGDVVVQTPHGVMLVSGATMEVSRLQEFSMGVNVSAAPRADATSGLYSVKYNRPFSTSSVSSYQSHDRATGCSSEGGYKYNCSANGPNNRSGHKGTDFAAGLGTSIWAAAPGVVVAIGGGCGSTTSCTSITPSCNYNQGNFVNVKHSNGAITRYMHMQKTVAVNGSSVTMLSRLGYVGSTGQSTGCHLHFQIDYAGTPYDPYYGPCSCTKESLWK